MSRLLVWLPAALLLAAASPAFSQGSAAARPGAGQDVPPARARLEAEVRRNFARVVRRQVGLDDQQMRQLVPITQRYEQQRRQLQMEERQARMRLAQLMRNDSTPDQSQVDQLLQQLISVPRRRAELMEGEQRELSAFMSPVQRARFMALQEQVRRRLEQMRQRRMP